MQAVSDLKSWLKSFTTGELRIHGMVIVGAIVVLTLLQPFGTQVMPLWQRLIYWSICIPAGFVGSQAFDLFVRPPLIKRQLRWAIPPLHIAAITVAALAAVLCLEPIFREPIPLRLLVWLAGSVALVSAALWGIVQLGVGPGVERIGHAADPAFEAFKATWPAELQGAALRAMAAEDHYTRLYTSAGEALLSGRFRDALDAVKDQSGTQVHRSWWASGADLTKLDRRGGKWHLILTDDLEVPVSRRFRSEVRALGWDKLT